MWGADAGDMEAATVSDATLIERQRPFIWVCSCGADNLALGVGIDHPDPPEGLRLKCVECGASPRGVTDIEAAEQAIRDDAEFRRIGF